MYQLDKDVQIVIVCPQYTSDQGDISTCIHKINIAMITFDAVIYISLLMWRNSTKTQCNSKCHIIITMSKHQSLKSLAHPLCIARPVVVYEPGGPQKLM